jgi:hypothetical protein
MRVNKYEQYSYFCRTPSAGDSALLRPLRAGLAGAALLALGGCGSVDAALGVPTSLAAHEVCSAVFISGLDAERVYAADVAPQLGAAAGLVAPKVDRETRAVSASLAGLAPRRAVHRGALGCVVDQGVAPPTVAAQAPAARPSALAGPEPVTPADPALAAALDLAFAENDRPPLRRTYAAVIVHDGRVVAERYAPGIGVATPLHGWSMTKSVTNALLGVLVRLGRLDMRRPAPVAEWRDPADPRHAITADDLLRMRSGLDVGQSLSSGWDAPFNRANQIMFARPDMAGAAARRGLRKTPATAWRYSDGNTAILGRLVRDLGGGGDAAATQAFARRALFDPLGMGPVTMETDATGSPIGATQVYASARDWARLGQLFLDDGVAGGERILPEGWVAYSTQATPGSEPYGYGAGFWVNGGAGARRTRPGMPADSFMARGARGQYVVVVPSARLVIVKLGDADTPGGDIAQMDRFVAAVVAAAPR